MPCRPSNGATIHGVYSLTPTVAVSLPTAKVTLPSCSSKVAVNGHFIGCLSLPGGPVSFDSMTLPFRRTWYCCPPMCVPFGRGLVE